MSRSLGRVVGVIVGVLILLIFVFVLIGNLVGGYVHHNRCVGIIKINGPIMVQQDNGLFAEVGASSDRIRKLIREAEQRPDIGAVVFEINSPGGSVVASEEIYQQIKEMKKPTVAYLREMGASGGYYVALGANKIIAHPDTITGSIGVRMVIVDISGLYHKLGINETSLTSGPLKDMGGNRPMTEEERKVFESIIMEVFEVFKSRVLERKAVRAEVFDGRIMTGRQAYAYGLVDGIGSYDDAIMIASNLTGSSRKLEVCELDDEPTIFDVLSASLRLRKPSPGVELTYR